MSEETQQATASPRLWPLFVLLPLIWVLKGLPALFKEPSMAVMMTSFFGPAICGVLILVWWLFLSRLPWRERIMGTVGIVLVALVTTLLSHVSMQGFGTMGYAVPWGMTISTLAFLIANKLGVRRTEIAVLAAFLGFGYWSLIRSEGVWGDFRSDQSFRWEPTPEEQILVDLENQANAKATLVASEEAITAEWPGFRGPKRNSVVPGVRLAEDWNGQAPQELWRIRVGPGWSSFAVAGQQLFTQEQRGDNEVVVSYDTETGAEHWVYAYPSRFWEALAGAGPRATPTVHNGSLYALGAEGLLHRLDPATGEAAWQADLRKDTQREPPMWGFSSSPLVVNGTVIVHAGGEGDRGVVAYDTETGAYRWGVPSGGHSYSSPQLSNFMGAASVPVVADDGLTLIDPHQGTVRWKYEWPSDNYRALQPLMLSESSFLITTGMGIGTRRLDLSGSGDALTAEEKWTSRGMKSDFNDYVAHEGYLYGFDMNIFACINLETGERQWKRGRYGNGQVLLLPDADQLLLAAESGELILLRTNPEKLEELARVEVLEGKTWNHHVLVGDRVYLRNGAEAVGLKMPLS